MAAFTSVTSGNWNDGATWGHTSPGTKGTDWPGATGDTFNIANVAHEVTYNVSETNELGASSISGKLIFSPSMSTKITFGNVVLTGVSGGELRIGTATVPIDKAYTAELVFNTTSDATNNMAFANGFLYSMYGDSTYCSSWETTLANNAENTDSDNVIITNDDMSAIWHNGDEITIKREIMGDSSSYTDAVLKTSISSMSGTTITVADNVTGMVADVGNTWVSYVVNVTRNVKLGKLNASTVVGNYNTNRPRFLDSTTGTNLNRISHAQFTGFGRLQMFGVTLTNVVIRNGEHAFSSSSSNTVSGNIYSCNYGLYSSSSNTVSGNIYSCNFGLYSSSSNTVSGNIYSCYYSLYSSSNNNTVSGNIYSCYCGLYSSNNNTVSGNIYSCYYGLYSSSNNNTVSGNIYSCTYGLYSSNNNTVSGNIYSCTYGLSFFSSNTISGKLGYNSADASLPNTYDGRGDNDARLLNCKLPAAGLVFYDRNTIGRYTRILCEHTNRSLNAFKIYDNMGDIVRTPCNGSGTSPSIDPDGGTADCLEVSNLQSNLTIKDAIAILNKFEYRIWATASASKIYTFKIQSIFTATLANTEISLTGSYLSSTDGSRTIIASTGTIAARETAADWTQTLSVTINPSQDGWVDIQIVLGKYESGKKIYVWSKMAIS